MASVAFLGMGVMGAPMAGHLVSAGHDVTVFNRSAEKAAMFVARHAGACKASTPREAAAGADIVFSCVGADKDSLDVALDPDHGAIKGMPTGSVFVDHTTVSADAARQMATAFDAAGIGFVDAPVSGGQAGAENGLLTIMCGGTKAAFDAAEPVMQAYGRTIRLLGGAGAGQTTKMVNQVCIAGVLQGLSEALNLAIEAGLDADAVVDVISGGAAQSWQIDNRAKTMARGDFDFGFAVEWMRKDLAIVLDEAKRLGLSMPMTALVDQFYADVEALGGKRQDTSSLIRRFRG